MKQKALFLDRDGVINKKAPKAHYITKWAEWEWMSGSKEAICMLKKAGYQVIVSVGAPEENLIGSNCGQFLMTHLTALKKLQDRL